MNELLTKLEALESNIKYCFKDKTLLENVLIHPSILASNKASHFERCEFLGDRVLGLIIADLVYREFCDEKEGMLAKRLAKLVCKETLLKCAQLIELDQFVQVDHILNVKLSSIMADAMEAVIGAVYLDCDFKTTQKVVNALWKPFVDDSLQIELDYKSALQEMVQKKGYPIPLYTIINQEGPSHCPLFQIEVSVAGIDETAIGTGPNKQEAQKNAAREMVEKLKSIRLKKKVKK